MANLILPDRYAPGLRHAGSGAKPRGEIELDPHHALAANVMFAQPFAAAPTAEFDDGVPYAPLRDYRTQFIPTIQRTGSADSVRMASIGDKFTDRVWRQAIGTDSAQEFGLEYPFHPLMDWPSDDGYIVMMARIRWDGAPESSGSRILTRRTSSGGSDDYAIGYESETGSTMTPYVRIAALTVRGPTGSLNSNTWYRYYAGQDQTGKFLYVFSDDGQLLISEFAGRNNIPSTSIPITIGHRYQESRNVSGEIDFAFALGGIYRGRNHRDTLTRDPWQLFRPVRPPVYIGESGAPGPGKDADPEDLTHPHGISVPSAQRTTFADGDDLTHPHEISVPSAQRTTFADGDDLTHPHDIDTPAAQRTTFADSDDLSHPHGIDTPAAQRTTFATVDDLSHQHTITQPNAVPQDQAVPTPLQHLHTIGEPGTQRLTNADGDDLTQPHGIDTPTAQRTTFATADDLSHLHEIGEPGATAETPVPEPQSLSHLHTISRPRIITDNTLDEAFIEQYDDDWRPHDRPTPYRRRR